MPPSEYSVRRHRERVRTFGFVAASGLTFVVVAFSFLTIWIDSWDSGRVDPNLVREFLFPVLTWNSSGS